MALGQADAGGGVHKTLAQQPTHIRNTLRVLHRTREFAPHPVAVHPRVPQPVAQQVTRALLMLGSTDRGRALLARVPIHEIGPASMADYRPLADWHLEPFYVE